MRLREAGFSLGGRPITYILIADEKGYQLLAVSGLVSYLYDSRQPLRGVIEVVD